MKKILIFCFLFFAFSIPFCFADNQIVPDYIIVSGNNSCTGCATVDGRYDFSGYLGGYPQWCYQGCIIGSNANWLIDMTSNSWNGIDSTFIPVAGLWDAGYPASGDWSGTPFLTFGYNAVDCPTATTTTSGFTEKQPSDIITAQASMVAILECWAAALVFLILIAFLWKPIKKIWMP